MTPSRIVHYIPVGFRVALAAEQYFFIHTRYFSASSKKLALGLTRYLVLITTVVRIR